MNNINVLKEQLQENLVIYLDGMDNKILNDICDIVVNTINEFEEN